MRIRQARLGDQDALYEICLLTANFGNDASAAYRDPRLIGHIYSVPYLHASPDLCFVAEDDSGVCGYIVGTADTRHYQSRLEEMWWPALRLKYQKPDLSRQTEWTPDELRSYFFHHPETTPTDVATEFPAHIHMNLLERARGRGMGRDLLQAWFSKAVAVGVSAVHLGASKKNANAVGFWQYQGFRPIATVANYDMNPTVWLGQKVR